MKELFRKVWLVSAAWQLPSPPALAPAVVPPLTDLKQELNPVCLQRQQSQRREVESVCEGANVEGSTQKANLGLCRGIGVRSQFAPVKLGILSEAGTGRHHQLGGFGSVI